MNNILQTTNSMSIQKKKMLLVDRALRACRGTKCGCPSYEGAKTEALCHSRLVTIKTPLCSSAEKTPKVCSSTSSSWDVQQFSNQHSLWRDYLKYVGCVLLTSYCYQVKKYTNLNKLIFLF